MSRKASKRVSKKPVAEAVMDGMDQKPEVVSMMAPLPSPGMVLGAAVAKTMSPKKSKSRSKSPKKSKSRSKSPKRAASPRKVKVLAFGMMPSESVPAQKPMSPRRMSKTKSK
jgi:hypothetical protein